MQFTRCYHVQYVSYTGHVLHVGNLHMSYVCMCVVHLVDHTALPSMCPMCPRVSTRVRLCPRVSSVTVCVWVRDCP